MPSAANKSRHTQTVGLRYWMLSVLEECDKVAADFSPDPVHDLRVSLRRCRSLADGLMALDPSPDLKAMKRAGKRLFQRLGDLRDIHVMQEWIEKLDPAKELDLDKESDEVASGSATRNRSLSEQAANLSDANGDSPATPAQVLIKVLLQREQEQKREAKAALDDFDRKQWRQWSKLLPHRAARFRPGSALFKHVALERWLAARELHDRALRNRSQSAFHALRIGIKRFRYIVENFLPAEHKAWSNDLKEMQDLLGEVHDLDVLWSTAVSLHIFSDSESRKTWHDRIVEQRTKRIERYRQKMVGPNSLWNVWREALPQGKQVYALALRRMKLWASALDPDFPHSERVANLALQLYDGLLVLAWEPAIDAASARSSLLAAALLHDVGKSKDGKGHQKTSLKLIHKHGSSPGWKEADLERAAIVARFHCGALPTRKHKLLRDLLPDEQKGTIQLAAILRLANALDTAHDGHILRIQLEQPRNGRERKLKSKTHTKKSMNGFQRKVVGLAPHQPLVIAAEGYSPLGRSAQAIAAERHLLETVLHRPILVKAMRHANVSTSHS
jgi:CHAD domain-containing protein/HD superfamily phosphodiesterase